MRIIFCHKIKYELQNGSPPPHPYTFTLIFQTLNMPSPTSKHRQKYYLPVCSLVYKDILFGVSHPHSMSTVQVLPGLY